MPKLEDKITNPADLASFGRPARQMMTFDRTNYYMPWWLKREWLRIERKVYPEASSVIETLNDMTPQFALHVSKEDPQYVAYTPDKASGEADRQLKTSLGKFIAKYYPHFKDDEVGRMVADHLGEVTGEVELIYGQDIINAYIHATGTASCMTKSTSTFNLGGHHPSEVYDMPNIAMAVVRDNSGNITSRSMVYMPTPEDKRYIRVYGDGKLTKRLVRAGFKPGCWYGAEFKKILLKGGHNRYLMPYLDGDGSMGSSSRSNVVLLDGKMMSVNLESADGIRSACGTESVRVATSTGGWHEFTEVSSTQFNKTCEVSGVMVNCLIEKLQPFYADINDLTKVFMVCQAVYDAGKSVSIRRAKGDYPRQYRMSADIATFEWGGQHYPDTYNQRVYAGFMKLDPAYYPDEQDWIAPNPWTGTPEGYIQTGNNHLVKAVDGVSAIIANNLTAVHQQVVGKGWVKVHSINKGVDLYADPQTTVVKTTTGRKVVPQVHAVAKTVDGTWDFTRNLNKISMFGERVWHRKDVTMTYGSKESLPLLHKLIERLLTNYEGHTVFSAITYIIRTYISDYAIVRGRSMYNYTANELPAWDELYPVLKADRQIVHKSHGLPLLEQLNTYYTRWKAEAEAIDYNGQHDVSMNTCPEVEATVGVTVPLPPTSIYMTGTGTSIASAVYAGGTTATTAILRTGTYA